MRWKIFGLWLCAWIPLLIALNGAPVARAQEGRVVETARQMLGHGPRAWLIPSLNGQIRLRKPPLAYWMAATSFTLFGVNEFTARLPTVLVSWLTIGVTYSIARRRFGETCGLLSAACLLSSYLFVRFGRLAETDAPAMLLTTLAIDYFWRAVDDDGINDSWHFHLAAAATGLSLCAKQGPGFFAPLFFVCLCLFRRKPKTIWRFVRCGAMGTLIVLAAWWYAYAAATRGIMQFQRELAEVTEGIDHSAPFYVYVPLVLLGCGAWWLLVLGAFVAAWDRRMDANVGALALWGLCCFVPLCFLGNKQDQYLLSTMPPLMILAGWLLSLASAPNADARLVGVVRNLLAIVIWSTACVCAIGFPMVAEMTRHQIIALDWILGEGMLAISIIAWWLLRKKSIPSAVCALAAGWAIALPLILNVWGETLDPLDIRNIAADIGRRFSGPMVFYGGDTSYPLCFALRREIPRFDPASPDLLVEAARRDPDLAVIWEVPQHGPGANLPPPQFVQVGADYGAKGQHFRIYQLAARQ